jgi:hypothetical protein
MASAGLPPRPASSKGKRWVFNVPPGWPTPPTGWEPPADWHPDPSWPPAPAAWEFWRPAPHREQRGGSFYIKAVAGVLTFAATITGTYLAYLAIKGQPQTTANWVRQANAACDQDIGPLHMSIYDGLVPSAVGQGNSPTQPSLVSKVSALIAFEGSLSKLVGDLGALQTPKDNRAPEIQTVLSSGNVFVDSLSNFSTIMQTIVEQPSGSATSQQLTELSNAQKHFLTANVAWKKAIEALGLTRCPGWGPIQTITPTESPTPPPTLPTTPPPSSTTALTDGEQQLINSLDPNDLTGCTGRPDLEGGSIVAAVNCHTVEAGPTTQPVIVQFSDLGSAQAWFSNITAGYVDRGDCADGYKLGTWTYNNLTAGTLGCTYTGDGSFRVVWIINSALIGVTAVGSDGPTVYAWWTKSAYVISSPG